MTEKLVLVALILFNLGASAVLTGVYPGGATGYLTYPNGSIVGFVVGVGGASLYPGVAVLDACGNATLLVEPGGLLVYAVHGAGYALGLLQRSLPPYSLASNCYADVGQLLARPDGEAIEAQRGYIVADAYRGSMLLDAPQGLIVVEGGSAILYPNVHPVVYCSDGRILVAVNESLGVLDPQTGTLTLYLPEELLPYEAGGTQDWSTGACNAALIAYTSVYNSSKAIVLIDRRDGWCRIYYTTPPAEAAGVAANESIVTFAFEAPGEARVKEAPCSLETRTLHLKPEPISVELVEKRLESTEAPKPVRVSPSMYKPSPYADNIIVVVYRLGGAASTPTATPSATLTLSAVVVVAVAAAAAALYRRKVWRRGSAESAPQHGV